MLPESLFKESLFPLNRGFFSQFLKQVDFLHLLTKHCTIPKLLPRQNNCRSRRTYNLPVAFVRTWLLALRALHLEALCLPEVMLIKK